MTDADRFDPERIVETLNRHRVDYVLVGGYAARLYGARRPTYDFDIAPSTAPDNLHRLSEALRELGAGIRVDGLDQGLPFDSSAESLRGIQMLNLRTPMGDLDITFVPAGFPDGYDGLRHCHVGECRRPGRIGGVSTTRSDGVWFDGATFSGPTSFAGTDFGRCGNRNRARTNYIRDRAGDRR